MGAPATLVWPISTPHIFPYEQTLDLSQSITLLSLSLSLSPLSPFLSMDSDGNILVSVTSDDWESLLREAEPNIVKEIILHIALHRSHWIKHMWKLWFNHRPPTTQLRERH